jgi:hypothetical protein
MTADPGGQRPEIVSREEARQGVTGHNVRYVLFIGLAFAVVAGVVLYFSVGT